MDDPGLFEFLIAWNHTQPTRLHSKSVSIASSLCGQSLKPLGASSFPTCKMEMSKEAMWLGVTWPTVGGAYWLVLK